MTTITANNSNNRISTTITVDAGDNFALAVPTNNVEVLALDGNDTIDTGAGLVSNATFRGGLGNDSIAIGAGGAVSSTFFGGGGNDIVTVAGAFTSSGIQSLTGNNQFTTAVANLAFIQAGDGADTINLGQGNTLTQFSTVRAGAGNDSININGAVSNSSIFAGDGNDTISISALLTNTSVQTLTGNNTIGATVNGALTTSTVQTGSGADTIVLAGALTTSMVRTGQANDLITLTGAMTNSSIFAGQGNDTISLQGAVARTGSSFTTVTGDNRFVFDADSATAALITNNTFTGGSGDDRLVFTAAADATNLFTSNNFSGITTAEVAGGVLTTGPSITARGISNVLLTGPAGTGVVATGAINPLTITGNNNDNAITGGLGADTINAGGGTNTIGDAGIGADVIIHNTTFQGAPNLTTVTVDGTSQVTLTSTVNGATAQVANGIAGFVNASSSTSGVTLGKVNPANNFDITLIGGAGNDTISGGAGADSLIGGAGNDTITGGAGADVLTGGAGADRFVQSDTASIVISDATLTAAGVADGDTITIADAGGVGVADIITDFNALQGDLLALTSVAGGAVDIFGSGTDVNGIGTVVANSAAFVRGTYAAATGVFTVANTTGLDTLVIRNVNAIVANTALTQANLGNADNTSVTVLQNFTGFATANLVAV